MRLILLFSLLLAGLGPSPGALAAPPSNAPPALPPPPPELAASAAGPLASPNRPRIAIPELLLEGEGTSPAMAMQLQDGFVLGFVRAGIDVLDPADVSRRLAGTPELQNCETSPCLKRLGTALGVRFVLRVRVQVSGTSYKMSARLFSTEGAAPAALPVASHVRPCEVCTVAEAREEMIKLADSVKGPVEAAAATARPLPAPAPPVPSLQAPALTLAAGIGAAVLGVALLDLADGSGKGLPFLAGALVGAGLGAAGVSVYVLAERRAREGAPPAGGGPSRAQAGGAGRASGPLGLTLNVALRF